MSWKRTLSAGPTQPAANSELDPRYLGYFECFNQQLFFEAHEALEKLWLTQRAAPAGLFYKGLIQLAGAFVHIQKGRRQPALSLFRLARENLAPYPSRYESLDTRGVLALIATWMGRVEAADGLSLDPVPSDWPHLSLEPPDASRAGPATLDHACLAPRKPPGKS